AKLNMEMSIAAGIVRIAGELKPDQCTLVPDKREELTTEGGLNVKKFARRIRRVVSDLHKKGITLSAFIEPDLDQIRASADCGFDAIELWTGGYAHAKTPRAIQREIKRLDRGVETGIECGLEVHGGHGLTYRNIERIAAIPGFGEFNIGHAIVARATLVGMRTAVEQMKDLLYQYSPVELM
ncbi:MAG: pyridoxine 5'-phosphate synthase, partial [Planctomycetes bacterium]|nr:pyridoxine 5'-phosphate synthase [Planctomycetota bacterium]